MIRALYTILGENTKSPTISENEIGNFLIKFQKESVFTLKAVVYFCLFIWTITPILTILIPWPAFWLPEKLREKHTYRLTTSRIYLLRQCMVLLKQFTGIIYGAHNTVRESLNIKTYDSDPDKYRQSSLPDSHIGFTPKSAVRKTIKLKADYVVVGSGAGGSAVAIELARAGYHIIVVEAGPWLDPQKYPNTFYGAMKNVFDSWGANATLGKTLSPIVQASCVGGTPVINSAIVVRTPNDIFDIWQNKHGINISREKIWEIQNQIERELYVGKITTDYLGESNRLALVADKLKNIQGGITDRNVKNCLGSGNCMYGCKNNRKQTPNITWIPEILALDGLLLSCAPVDKVVVTNGLAKEVCGHFVHPHTKEVGCEFKLTAKKGIILAASATHTPCILQRSKIKLPAVGEFFRSHPGSMVIGVYSKPLINKNMVGATQGWSSTKFIDKGFKLETLNLPLELLISRLPGAGKNFQEMLRLSTHMAMWIAVVRADNSVGRVRYNHWLKNPSVYYSMHEKDVAKLRHGMHILAQMHFAAGAVAVIPGIYGLPPLLRPKEVDFILNADHNPQNYVTILSHLFGGAVMGDNPHTSVCDQNGKVHGVENLYIADASAIPTVLGVNPQHTIMALAIRLAHHLIQKAT